MSTISLSTSPIADSLISLSALPTPVQVRLSHELVRLLSEQLYQSPLKAIEELVVNGYDADARECRIFVPTSEVDPFIVVYDNGIGMPREGLSNLWHIGHSNKRDEEIEKRSQRKQIGKFGIGKLATYTIGNRLTYISRSEEGVLSVTVDFKKFESSLTGVDTLIEVPVHVIRDWEEFADDPATSQMLSAISINPRQLTSKGSPHWTLAILEDLKDKARKIQIGDLRWVLRTAMPLKSDFRVNLNGENVSSSKDDYEIVISFNLGELSPERLSNISNKTGKQWQSIGGVLKSDSFPTGISGTVIVTHRTLCGKSDDLQRSHGFFVRVRERLVNDSDPLFGLTPLEHKTFNRFRADIQADDLDVALKASREAVEESAMKNDFRVVLREIFNEADSQYDRKMKPPSNKGKKEGGITTVPPRLVDYIVADAILTDNNSDEGAEADNSWFYVNVPKDVDTADLIKRLYTENRKYKYEYTQAGASGRLVQFDPDKAIFWLNQDHELVQEYANDARSKTLLEDIVSAEALLEVYLRESHMPPHIIGSVLERRDALLRSLVRDHTYSSEMVARSLREAYNDEYRLEVSLVVAARTLGFVANHVSGSGEPDGLARFHDYPDGIKKIILEAKSSDGTPSLGAIDFGGLREHMDNHEADGCLLVAPSYPGEAFEGDNAVARRARIEKISCWTVELLAKFVEQAEIQQLNARHVLKIVLENFAPDDVEKAVNELLNQSGWSDNEVHKGILRALRVLEENVSDPRSIDMIATIMAVNEPMFKKIGFNIVEGYVRIMMGASSGGLILRDKTVIINVSIEELERRLSSLTKTPGDPRTISGFRDNEKH
jgi:Histidine kinase-, DNA gyrase B-, and HSP90-like ATPase